MSVERPLRVVGVDVGGTKLHALVADEQGRVFGRARKKVGKDKSFGAVMERLETAVREACAEAGVGLADVQAVGLGAPSPMLPDGTAVRAPNLGWEQVPLGPTAARILGRPCFAANDCDAGTYGEATFGSARGARTVVGLFVGTGLGGGIVLDGEVVNGDHHLAAEVGHMVVVKDGRRCGCGHRGCLEAYVSKTGMARRLEKEVRERGRKTVLSAACEGDFATLRSNMLAEAYASGDALAVEVLHESAEYLGLGVGNLITLLGPSVVVLGGGVLAALGPALIDRVRQAAAAVAFPAPSFAAADIRLASLGDDAVALGAVGWALRQLRRPAPG
jgi:glucokinase